MGSTTSRSRSGTPPSPPSRKDTLPARKPAYLKKARTPRLPATLVATQARRVAIEVEPWTRAAATWSSRVENHRSTTSVGLQAM